MILDLVIKTPSKIPVIGQDFSNWISSELKNNGFDSNWQVEVMLVCDRRMQGLNKKYRHIDKTTDVLSFPLFEKPPKNGNKQVLGSIVISVAQAKKQAIDGNRSLSDELEFLTRHSVKHLVGKHHK